MDPNRKFWNEQQQVLKSSLQHESQTRQAIECFLNQHAMVHSASMSGTGLWSFEDEIWQATNEVEARGVPPNSEHSIAWIFWHIARIEDVTMNLLVAGSEQVMNQDRWHERLNVPASDTGNALDISAVEELSKTIDLDALRLYRLAVGRRTRTIVQLLSPQQLKLKVDPKRLERVTAEGAVLPAAQEIIEYWGSRTIAGLLLMPPTRHNFIHLNEALRLAGRTKSH